MQEKGRHCPTESHALPLWRPRIAGRQSTPTAEIQAIPIECFDSAWIYRFIRLIRVRPNDAKNKSRGNSPIDRPRFFYSAG